jgi:uncharacterized ferritin-like protein (DUF455 family)
MNPRSHDLHSDEPAGTLTRAACEILCAADPAEKAMLSVRTAAAWRLGSISEIGTETPPARPARPPQPVLRPPRDVPRRRINGNPAGRIALLHALTHIELNAIDLAWDIIARFAASEDLPRPYYDDWVGVAVEEAKHFTLLSNRLASLDSAYGALPAHGGLWEAATATAHDLAGRLAVVPLVLEARGLDVTPAMIVKLRAAGDDASADILQIIHDDEIGHVAVGRRWFGYWCERSDVRPDLAFHALVRRYFKGKLKAPFNRASRDRAGLPPGFYEPLAS